MSCHPDRARTNQSHVNPEPLTQVVSTLVIRTVEKDVRTILEFVDQQYTNDDLRQAMKRLRRWVGYSK